MLRSDIMKTPSVKSGATRFLPWWSLVYLWRNLSENSVNSCGSLFLWLSYAFLSSLHLPSAFERVVKVLTAALLASFGMLEKQSCLGSLRTLTCWRDFLFAMLLQHSYQNLCFLGSVEPTSIMRPWFLDPYSSFTSFPSYHPQPLIMKMTDSSIWP